MLSEYAEFAVSHKWETLFNDQMRSASKPTFLFCILQNGRFMNNFDINSLQAKFMSCH